MSRAKKKPVDGGGNPAVAPKAPATDAVAQGEQTGVDGETLTGPAADAGAGAPEGVIASSGGSADAELRTAASAVLAARHEVDVLTSRLLRHIDGDLVTADALEEVRAALRAQNTDPEHLAVVSGILAFLRPAAPVDAPAAEPDADLVEITARSRDGKPFRRGSVAWTGDFKTVAVTPAVAERIAADPNLVVKG